MSKRVSRIDSQLNTKTELLRAAEKEFAQLGFEGAAVDKITAHAGFSRGAFYSNFNSKEDLFLALVESKMNVFIKDLDSLLKSSGRNLEEEVRKYYLAQARDKIMTLLMTEFLTVGIRNSKLRARVASLNKSYLEAMGKIIGLVFETQSKKNKKDPMQAATILLSAGQGLMLHHFGNEKNFDQSYIEQAMELLYQKIVLE